MTEPAVVLPDVIVDCSHVGRKTTGIERITNELFSDDVLSEFNVQRIEAGSVGAMIFQQWVGVVMAAWRKRYSVVVTPGFPPSVMLSLLCGKRVIPYIHDVFLLTRQDELNIRAKYYMRPSFYFAVKTLKLFFVNSQKTADDLQQFCRHDARIVLFRPEVRNVFGLEYMAERYQHVMLSKMKIVMLGTLEPRKNYRGALAVFQALQEKLGKDIELHIIGRLGWGEEAELLSKADGVICHGYLDKQQIRQLVESATFYLSSSHDEGLGLPLLELQYSGIAVVASDIDVFSEVLGDSGLLVNINNPTAAAERILGHFADPQWLQAQAQKALTNIQRWNTLAAADKQQALSLLRG